MTKKLDHESFAAPPLADLQRWFQAVVTHPGGVAAGATTDEAQQLGAAYSVDAVALPSSQQSATERLEVYAHAYWARLLECLREEFPVLRLTIGDEALDRFAAGYLQIYPSQSYTLARLSEHFPACLAATFAAGDSAALDDFGRFVVELAEFERAINDVFDLEGGETLGFLTPEELNSVPVERRGELRLRPLPTFRLLAFSHDINSLFTAARAGDETPAVPERRPTFVALSRRGFVVRRTALNRAQYTLLRSLADGLALGPAVAKLLAEPTSPADEAAEEVDADKFRRWFAAWAQAGFFQRFEASSNDSGG